MQKPTGFFYKTQSLFGDGNMSNETSQLPYKPMQAVGIHPAPIPKFKLHANNP